MLHRLILTVFIQLYQHPTLIFIIPQNKLQSYQIRLFISHILPLCFRTKYVKYNRSQKDLNMLNTSKIGKFLEKQFLKSILQYLVTNSEWTKWISQLARTTAVIFDNKNVKQKKPKCLICNKPHDNYLLLIFHLELYHQEEIQITRYQFFQETLTIFLKPHHQKNIRNLYERDESHQFHLLYSLKERQNRISQSILPKFSKKQSAHKKKYFHPVNIFKYIEQSQEQSEDPYGNIEQQLQRIKISEFTDVNQNDKLFFIKWNEAVHKAKKVHVYLSDSVMRELLEVFAKEAKANGLKRANLVMHAFTLWSSGKITSDSVFMFLDAYDKAL